MNAKDDDHGIHGLLPRDAAAGRFIVIIPVSGFFSPTFHELEVCTHHMRWCLNQWKRFLLVSNLGCSFLVKVLVDGPPGMGGNFFSAMHSLCHRARRATFSFLQSRLSPVLYFCAEYPPPLLGF